METAFNLGETVIAPNGEAEILMIVGPRSDRPNEENNYSILYKKSGIQAWCRESKLRPSNS